MIKKYHRVTKDTPNPVYDRRRRYGIEAVDVFREGLIIRETERTETIGGHEIPVSHFCFGGKHSIEGKKLFDALPTEPTEPTPEEVYISNYRECASDTFVLAMLREGKLKIEDVEEYFNRDEDELAAALKS